MFCNKCGTNLPDDSVFCSKCGTRLESKVSLNKEQREETKPAPPATRQPEKLCRACYKPLTSKWKKCPYCDEPNPFYEGSESQSDKPSPTVSVQADDNNQFIIKLSSVCFIISIAALVIALTFLLMCISAQATMVLLGMNSVCYIILMNQDWDCTLI